MMTSETPPQATALQASVSDGSSAIVIGYGNGVLTLTSEVAHPPGRPLKITARHGGDNLALEGRAIGSKRSEDGRYTVTLRLTSLRREARVLLETLFAATS
jgi:hypothetical protein